MPSADKVPDGWFEPIPEGMWKHDELFGIPRAVNTVHVLLVVLAILHSVSWLYGAAALHTCFVALTQWDPEWPAVFQDFMDHSGELEP